MQYDALGPDAARKLDYDRALTFGIGLYNMVTFLNFLLTGWPSFGFIHRLCLKRFGMAKEHLEDQRTPGKTGGRVPRISLYYESYTVHEP